ncbi:hypothetical protein AHF37_00271 [Paragonimus kellicotti]|nr:hypothetical protein AHF37_00271 [Paragonimus kellicotti]
MKEAWGTARAYVATANATESSLDKNFWAMVISVTTSKPTYDVSDNRGWFFNCVYCQRFWSAAQRYGHNPPLRIRGFRVYWPPSRQTDRRFTALRGYTIELHRRILGLGEENFKLPSGRSLTEETDHELWSLEVAPVNPQAPVDSFISSCNREVSEKTVGQLKVVVLTNGSAFAWEGAPPGRSSPIQHRINTGELITLRKPPRRILALYRDQLKNRRDREEEVIGKGGGYSGNTRMRGRQMKNQTGTWIH